MPVEGEGAIVVRNLDVVKKTLKEVDRELPKQLRVGLNKFADVIVVAVRSKVPTVTGAARDSIKARSTQTAARIAVGGDKATYYPWLDFGGRTGRNKTAVRTFIKEGRYVYPTLREKRSEMLKMLDEIIADLAQKAGL